MFKKLLIPVLVVAASGCTTRNMDVPEWPTHTAEPLQLANEQIDVGNRVIFSDGITTFKSSYVGWNDIVISEIAKKVKTANTPLKIQDEKFGVVIHSIQCTGHYVIDCDMTIGVTNDNSFKKIYNSGFVSSYPLPNAITKSINVVTDHVVADGEFMSTVYK